MKITAERVAAACGAALPAGTAPDLIITGVSTDTREDLRGKLFIPLKGPNFDGHKFIQAAFQNGAAAVLSEEGGDGVIEVQSTLKAMADLAAYYRGLFQLPVIAVTGSAGKTTTKDLIASVLSQKFNTLKTAGNLNNEIGLPQMIFRLDQTYEAAVLEMGMNHAGEIHRLCRMGRPDICVITNIGTAHIENLGSREGILAAKSEIFDFMNPHGAAVLNGDDDLLATLRKSPKLAGKRIVYYGTGLCEPQPDVWVDEITQLGAWKQSCVIHYHGESVKVTIPLPGAHMVLNALAAASVGYLAGLSAEQIKAGIQNFTPSGNRMEVIDTGGVTIINDAYNANPQSMKAALEVLLNAAQKTGSRPAAILGDMLELGAASADSHRQIGAFAAESGVKLLLCVGNDARLMYEAFSQNARPGQVAASFGTKEECAEKLPRYIEPGDTVLIKASHAIGLEFIVETLKKRER